MTSAEKKLRIGIDASAMLIARKNGYENYVDALLRHLVALPPADRAGLELIFYFHAGNPLADARQLEALLPQFAGFRCRVYRPGRFFGLYLPLMARLDRLDWLHLPVYMWRGKFPCKVLTTFHDACSRRAVMEGLLREEPPEQRNLIDRQLQLSDAYIAVSESSARDLHALYGVPVERIFVAHHGVEDTYHPDEQAAAAARAQYSLPPYILTVNALQGNKNYVHLLRAFAQLKRRHAIPHVLAVVGRDGWGAELVHEEIERLQLGDSLRCLGFVPTESLRGLYSGADLVVNASLCEGFGLPILEALACGAVVACSNATSLPEVGGDAVAYFNPRDAQNMAEVIHSALSDEARRFQLREAGHRRVTELTWQVAANRTVDIYRSLEGIQESHSAAS